MIGMFTAKLDDIEQKYTFKAFGTALDACVPSDQKEWVREQLEGQQENRSGIRRTIIKPWRTFCSS
jgi:hypothetical protein